MDLDALRKQKQQRKQFQAVRDNIHRFNSTQPSEEAIRLYNLAKCHYDGLEGCEENTHLAMEEYLKAAELGHTQAMTEVGYDYADSEDSILGYDLEKAEKWGNKAIESGDPDGYFTLYNVCVERGNGQEAFNLLEKGAELGSKDCIEELADDLYYGVGPADYEIEEDEERAFKLLASLEWDEDHLTALERLADLYAGYKKDPERALEYYEKVIQLSPSDYSVMTSLGRLLLNEEKVKDYKRAKQLLLEASENKEREAMNLLGLMYLEGKGMPVNIDMGIMWLTKASEEGSIAAMFNLGDYYKKNNKSEAIKWLKKAADWGAKVALDELKELGVAYTPNFTERENHERVTTESDDNNIVQDIIDVNLDNLSSILDAKRSRFKEIIKDIQKTIDSDEIDDYDKDRLRILQMALSFAYFEAHYLDEDFDKYEDIYYEIIDKIDEINPSMAYQNNEAEIIYLLANMYSIDRFQNVKPLDKLEQLWEDINKLELDESQMEFKPSFWLNKAKETYELQKRIFDNSDSHTSSSVSSVVSSRSSPIHSVVSSLPVSSIYTKLKKILIEKL